MILYHDNNQQAAREIRFTIEGDKCTFELQDIGPLPEMIYGDDEYEMVISNLPLEELMKAMGIRNAGELSEKLKLEYSSADAFDRFSKFCFGKGLHFDYYSG